MIQPLWALKMNQIAQIKSHRSDVLLPN